MKTIDLARHLIGECRASRLDECDAKSKSKKKSAPGDVTPTGFKAQEQGPSESVECVDEVLDKNSDVGEWIGDFVKSDNPKFAGKSKKDRIRQAVAAYYAKKRESN